MWLGGGDDQSLDEVLELSDVAGPVAAGQEIERVGLFMGGKWDVAAMINGFLAGLVAITCPCYWVSDVGSCILGAVAGVLVIGGMELLEYLRIDDPVGAWPVHGLCGIWGTLSLGLFACGRYSAAGSSPYGVPSIVANSPDALTGLFYGGGGKVLMAQGIGSLIVCSATFAAAMAMFWALKAVRLLRVSKEGELQGLDLDQHGISAYPEYVISALAAPHGMGRDTVGSGNLARAPEALNPATVVGGE